MNEERKGYLRFSEKEKLMPQEEVLETVPQKNKFTIGVPRELSPNENRVALVPDAVHLLVENGHRVLIERNAGASAHFTDAKFAEEGGEIVENAEDIYEADIITKIAPLTNEEIDMLGRRKIVFSSIFLPSRDKQYFLKLMAKKAKAIAYEYIQDKTGAFPVIRSMSEIIGNTAVLIAAEYMSNSKYGKGEMFGGFPGIKPTELMIIGAGTVAEYAARAAIGLGAYVKIFDDSMYKLRSIQNNLGRRIFTSPLQPKLLLKAMKEADVVISAKHSSGSLAPCLITEEMVMSMKAGAVIVDVSIDQGGCFETSRVTTHEDPVFQVHGVTHYCVPNIASRVPHTASYSLSNFLAPLILNMSDMGGIEQQLKRDSAFGKGVYIYNGILTNKFMADQHNLSFQDLDLLMAAFM
jgi:alanine dehydrogenase